MPRSAGSVARQKGDLDDERSCLRAVGPVSVSATRILIKNRTHRDDNARVCYSGRATYSHSIISQRFNSLFYAVFCASRLSHTVRDTAETDRWRAIDPDRSRRTRQARVVVFAPSASQRAQVPASFTVGHAADKDRWLDRARKLSKGRCAHLSCEALRTAEFNRRSNGRRIHNAQVGWSLPADRHQFSRGAEPLPLKPACSSKHSCGGLRADCFPTAWPSVQRHRDSCAARRRYDR
jgi:hypothetical protein